MIGDYLTEINVTSPTGIRRWRFGGADIAALIWDAIEKKVRPTRKGKAMTADPKDLGAMFDAHTAAEFKTRDIDATMATMSDSPHVTHVPTMTGGHGSRRGAALL